MNKDELTASRQAKDEAFDKLTELAKSEKRALTEDETKQVDGLKAERSEIDTKLNELTALETAEVADREAKELEAKEKADADSKREKDELETELATTKRELTNLQNEKLISNKRTNEMNENKLLVSLREAIVDPRGGTVITERAAIDGDIAALAAAIPSAVGPLSVIGKEPLWKIMGCSNLTGCQGNFVYPYQDPIVAALVAESTGLTGDSTSPTGIDVKPVRYTVQKKFTLHSLSSVTDEFLSAVLADMAKGVDRAITAAVYTKALAAATEVAAGAITKVGFDALQGGAEVDGAFMSDRASFFTAKGTAIDSGSGRFLAEKIVNGSASTGVCYDGTPYFYSNLFDDTSLKQFIVYADMAQILVSEFTGMEVIVDKYTLAADGEVVITMVKMANVACLNPGAFVKSPDLDGAV